MRKVYLFLFLTLVTAFVTSQYQAYKFWLLKNLEAASLCKTSECTSQIIASECNSNTGKSLKLFSSCGLSYGCSSSGSLCSFNGVLVACKNSRLFFRHHLWCWWEHETWSDWLNNTRIILGWDCVIDGLMHWKITDDSLFWSADSIKRGLGIKCGLPIGENCANCFWVR